MNARVLTGSGEGSGLGGTLRVSGGSVTGGAAAGVGLGSGVGGVGLTAGLAVG